MAVPTVTAAPGSPVNEGLATDIFDVSNGGTATASSAHPQVSGGTAPSSPNNAIGSTNNWQPTEPTHFVFDDTVASGPIDTLHIKTAAPITLTHYDIYLASDSANVTQRDASHFDLYAGLTATSLSLIDSGNILPGYNANYGAIEIRISDDLNVPNVQFFDLRLTRSNSGIGTRIVEVDGIPEPSCLGLLGLGAWMLARRLRRAA